MVKGLVSVAWADGHVADEEAEVIEALRQVFGATPSERREVTLYAKAPRTIDDVPVNELSYDDRRVKCSPARRAFHRARGRRAGGESERKPSCRVALCQKLRIPDVECEGNHRWRRRATREVEPHAR